MPATPTTSQKLVALLVRMTGRAIVLLPSALAINLGAAIGHVVATVAPIRRRVILDNLAIAFGPNMDRAERMRIARATYAQLGMMAVESQFLTFGALDWPLERVPEREGWHHFEALKAAGKPFVVVTGHFGNWELAGCYGSRFAGLTTLSKPLHNPAVNEDLRAGRERHGLRIVWTGSGNMLRQMLAEVRDGRCLTILPDQDMGSRGEMIPFLGRPASTTTVAAVLAIRHDMPILPVFLVRLGPTRHRMVVRPPIHPSECPDGTPDERAVQLTRRHIAELEDMIRLHPAQYFWFHRRWKTTAESLAQRKAGKREAAARKRAERSST